MEAEIIFSIVIIAMIIIIVFEHNQKYTKFRVQAMNDNKRFIVEVKGWFLWKSGYVYTDFFNTCYDTKEEALEAIELYKNRFTQVNC